MAIPNLKLRKPSAKYCDQVITLKLSELFGHSKSKIIRRKKCILVIYLEQVLCFEMSLYRRTFWQNSELHFHQLWNRTVSIRTINTNWNPAVLRALHDFLTTKTLWLILLDFSLLLFDLRRSRLTLCCKDTLYFSTIAKLFLNSSDLNEINPCNLLEVGLEPLSIWEGPSCYTTQERQSNYCRTQGITQKSTTDSGLQIKLNTW